MIEGSSFFTPLLDLDKLFQLEIAHLCAFFCVKNVFMASHRKHNTFVTHYYSAFLNMLCKELRQKLRQKMFNYDNDAAKIIIF